MNNLLDDHMGYHDVKCDEFNENTRWSYECVFHNLGGGENSAIGTGDGFGNGSLGRKKEFGFSWDVIDEHAINGVRRV